MKRCPQCEFIYEDDQSLCDMDGVLLVFDARTLPNLHALATVEAPLPARAHSRHRAFSAMAALILATVLSLVYFVSTQKTTPVVTPASGSMQTPVKDTSVTTPPSAEANNTIFETTQPPTSPATPEANAATAAMTKDDKKSDSPKTSNPPAKKTTAKAPVAQAQPEEPKKEDSKVGSILKKTGRLLKKPFKL